MRKNITIVLFSLLVIGGCAGNKVKESHYDTGVFLLKSGKEDEAIAAFQASLQADPEDPFVYQALGDLYHTRGWREQSLASWEKAYNFSSDDPAFYVGRDKKPRASAWIADAISARKASRDSLVQAYTKLATVAAEEKRWEDARKAWDRVCALDPKSVDGFKGAGKANKKLKDGEGAYKAWKVAAELAPNDSDAQKECGYSAFALEKLNEAERAFRRYSALKPDEPLAYNNLGTVLAKLNRFEESHASFDKALTMQPDMISALNGKATAYYYQKDNANARRLWSRVLELSPQDPIALENIRTLVQMGL